VSFLDLKCEGDPELRHAVEELLAVGDEMGSFLEAPVFAAAPMEGHGEATASFAAEGSSSRGDGGFQIDEVIFNRFKILRFVARGGMGEVWEAWDSQLRERVALQDDTRRHGAAS